MSRSTAVALAAAALLVGCPVPQPLPEYSGGAVTPPRIVVDDTNPSDRIAYPNTIVPVPVGCTSTVPPGTAPSFQLDAQIRDANPNSEPITARWFVNYDPANTSSSYWRFSETVVPAATDSTLRDLTPWTFRPYDYDVVGGAAAQELGKIHVVELVVSNGFARDENPGQAWKAGDPLPYRSPALGFEVQVYRWVFLNVPYSATCDAADLLCATCPP